MHRVARSLATAACCPKTTSAARLAARSLRSPAVVRLPATTAAVGLQSRRTIHVRVPLPYKVEDGLGDFLSPAALKVIAEDYQQGLLDRLNEQIKGALAERGWRPVAPPFFLLFFFLKTHTWGWGRYQARKSRRRSDRHLHCPAREANARIQLCESRAQQQFLPPPPREFPLH